LGQNRGGRFVQCDKTLGDLSLATKRYKFCRDKNAKVLSYATKCSVICLEGTLGDCAQSRRMLT
jgi:hypothetical protein